MVDIQHIVYPGPKYSEEQLLRKNGLWKSKGFYSKHKFEIPTGEDWAYGLEDNRNTLIWMPDVATDENGKLELKIPTSDIASLFNLKIIAWTPNDYGLGEALSKIRVIAKN